MLPLLYVVRMDVEPDYLAEFVKWYDTRHGPDLIGTGFHSCNAYHSVVGGPLICNVYEVPSVDVFSSPAYVAVREHDTQLVDEVLNKISNHSNTVYRQEVTVGVPKAALAPDERPSRVGAVNAPVVSTLRLDIAESAGADFKAWFERTEQARTELPGYLSARLARQHGKHPLFPSSQPEWLVLTEWATLAEAKADGGVEQITERFAAAFPGQASGFQYNVAALSATLLNSESWTV